MQKRNQIIAIITITIVAVVVLLVNSNQPLFSPIGDLSVIRTIDSDQMQVTLSVSSPADAKDLLIGEIVPTGFQASNFNYQPSINSDNTLAWLFDTPPSTSFDITYSLTKISDNPQTTFSGKIGAAFEYTTTGDSEIILPRFCQDSDGQFPIEKQYFIPGYATDETGTIDIDYCSQPDGGVIYDHYCENGVIQTAESFMCPNQCYEGPHSQGACYCISDTECPDGYSCVNEKCTEAVTPSLRAYYKFENNLNDETGTNNGAWSGQASYTQGRIGQAASFDGTLTTGNYVIVNSLSDFSPSQMSIGSWIKADNLDNVKIIAAKRSGSATGADLLGEFILDVYQGKPRFLIGDGTVYSRAVSSQTINTNTWYYITGTWDGSISKIYVNAVEKGSVAVSSLAANSMPVTIGSYTNYPQYRFDGLIDDLRLYTGALSTSEIEDIYNSAPPLPTGPVIIDPVQDGAILQWTTYSGTLHYAMIDDAVRYPSSPTTSTWIMATAPNQQDIVVSNTNLPQVTKVKIYTYGDDMMGGASVSISNDGNTWQTSQSLNFGARTGWDNNGAGRTFNVNWNNPQKLYTKYTFTGGARSFIYESYAEVS